MGNLYTTLRHRIPANARRVVDICAEELPEHATLDPTRLLDFAVFMRERTLDLVTNDHPLRTDDLAVVAAIGEERGRSGVPQSISRRLLALHATASMREIHEAAGPQDLDEEVHLLAWLGKHGTTGQQEYTLGFLRGENQHLPIIRQTRKFACMALNGDPAASSYAAEVGIRVADRHQVIVVRCAGTATENVLEMLWHRYHAPATWHRHGELAVLLPVDQDALTLVRDVAENVGPCAVGVANGQTLTDVFAMARRVSRVARVQDVPDHLTTMADVFIEIGVAELPGIDRWLRDVTRRLAAGPELVGTLDAFYRNDLDRARAATSLSVHPRTLDYRLRRVHELTGIDPRATNGIRVFTTAIARKQG